MTRKDKPRTNLFHTMIRWFFTGAMWVLPASKKITITGYPDTEDNAHVTALLLARSSRWPIRMLMLDSSKGERHFKLVSDWLGLPYDSTKITFYNRTYFRDAFEAITSKLVFYTHGLAGSPKPTGKRVHINLWHGTGPKGVANKTFTYTVGTKYIMGCAKSWAPDIARDLGVRNPVVIRGNIRNLLFAPPSPQYVQQKLDLKNDYVLWMPTYRRTDPSSTEFIEDGGSPAAFTALASSLAEAAKAAGVDLIVKPHPMDSFEWQQHGIKVITNDELSSAGIPLYGLVGSSSGLVSDYSSVWVDYLALDKPILLALPDLEAYKISRELYEPSFVDLMSAYVHRNETDVSNFFNSVLASKKVDDAGIDYREVKRALGYFAQDNLEQDFLADVATIIDSEKI